MPIFKGAAEVLRLLRILVRRPRRGEALSGEPGVRPGRRRGAVPIVCLVANPRQPGLLPALRADLVEGPAHVPHAYCLLADGQVTGQAAAPETKPQPPAAPDVDVVRALLAEAAMRLACGVKGRVRFTRFGLAHWLMDQQVHGQTADPDVVLKRLLRERDVTRRRWGGSQTGLDAELLPVWVRRLVVLVPPVLFWVKCRGWLPGEDGGYRWLRRQPYLAPRDPGGSIGFAERLTVRMRGQEDPEQLLRLLVNAFLADLRAAYRRRPWRLRAARRMAYPVLLLDGVTGANGGYRLLALINNVRNDTGEFDPLVVVSTSARVPPDALEPGGLASGMRTRPASGAADAYGAWCGRFSRDTRARQPTAWYLPLAVPRALPAPDDPHATAAERADYHAEVEALEALAPHLRLDRPPRWSSPLVPALAGLAVFASVLAGALVWRDQHCGLLPWQRDAGTLHTAAGGQCVGVAGNLDHFQPSLKAIGRRIQAGNEAIDGPHVTLVYVAPLSAINRDEQLVSLEQALLGIAAAQAKRNELHDAGFALRILFANAGDAMEYGPDIPGVLRQIMGHDRSIVGTVGLPQSRQVTADTIDKLTEIGLPVVAPTLSADELADKRPGGMYFQVSPQNKREAEVAARFAAAELFKPPSGDRTGIERSARIVVPADATDLYAVNLAEDAADELRRRVGGKIDKVEYSPTRSGEDPPRPAPSPQQVGEDLCSEGYRGLVFFAGRTDDFKLMLSAIENACRHRPPTIIGGDDISAFAADRRNRVAFTVPFYYLSFAVPSPSCEESALYRVLPEDLKEFTCQGGEDFDPSLDTHALLSYDMIYMYSEAVRHLLDVGVSHAAITPAGVWNKLATVDLDGLSGRINFQGGQFPLDKTVAVMRVNYDDQPPHVPRDRPTVQGACGKVGRSDQVSSWCPPPESHR